MQTIGSIMQHGRLSHVIVRYGFSTIALTALIGLFLTAGSTGCHHCDVENLCLQKEGLLVEDQIYPLCGAEPSHDGDRYTWETDTGSCSCTLESGDIAGYNWRNCTFEAN